MYGLSGIYLEKAEVTRSENLTDMRINVVFGFDHLEINGTYALKGWVAWTELDSDGERPFSIKMVNATLAIEMEIDLIEAEDYNARRYDFKIHTIFSREIEGVNCQTVRNHCVFTIFQQNEFFLFFS